MFQRAVAAALVLNAGPALAQTSRAPPAPSADWRVVMTDKEADVGRIIGFADAGTLARSGREVRFWLEYRLEKAAEGADGYRGYVTGDCSSYGYGSASLTMLDGARVLATGGEEKGLTAAPGSNMRVALDAVCARAFLTGKVDPVTHAKSQFGR